MVDNLLRVDIVVVIFWWSAAGNWRGLSSEYAPRSAAASAMRENEGPDMALDAREHSMEGVCVDCEEV